MDKLVAPVKLWMVNVSTNHRMTVSFSTEDQALEFLARKESTHAVSEMGDFPIPDSWTRLTERIYPTCEHGLNAWLCAGPEHYPTDQQMRSGQY